MPRGPTKTSKYIRQYGMTLQQMADKYGQSKNYLYTLHLQGKLLEYISQQEAWIAGHSPGEKAVEKKV